MWPLQAEDVEWLHFDLTNICNAKCPECVREIDNQCWPFLDKTALSLDLIKKRFTIDQLPRLTHVKFCGSFGDPLTHPNIIEIIEHFISEWPGIEIGIATNGGLKNVDLWTKLGKLLNSNLRHIIFGIDGLSDTNHMYRVGVNWKKLEENFTAFIEAGGYAQWQFIVFDHNKHQVFDARDYAIEKGFMRFYLVQSHRNENIDPKYNPKNYDVDYKKIEPVKIDSSKFHETKRELPPRKEFPKNTTDIDCQVLGHRDIMIMNDGSVYPCCHIGARMYSNDLKIEAWHKLAGGKEVSNLHNHPIGEILNNDFFKYIYASWEKAKDDPLGKCQACIETCEKKVARDILTDLVEL
jgi:MoaA/NifB/PqqE/SkfB family radical SAM enzyme